MPKITIDLTQEEADAFVEMGVEIEPYLKSIANSHAVQKLDNEFASKTKEEKEEALKPKVITP